MVNDYGGAVLNFQKYSGRIVFKFDVGAGYMTVRDISFKQDVEYSFECVVER